MTPWLRRDIHVVTRVRETFGTSPFIAIQVRRGDKITEQNAGFRHDVKVITPRTIRPEGTNAVSCGTLAVCQEFRIAAAGST